jgi:hypothetical protein
MGKRRKKWEGDGCGGNSWEVAEASPVHRRSIAVFATAAAFVASEGYVASWGEIAIGQRITAGYCAEKNAGEENPR